MNTVKPVARIVSFALLLAIVLYVLTYLAKPDSYNYDHIMGFYSEKPNSIDMVYLGGSAAFVYYAPLQAWQDHGIVAYDYATDTIQPELYKMMAREVLKTQSPKLLVVDARAFQYRDADSFQAQPPWEVPYRNLLTGVRLSANKAEFIHQYVGTAFEDKKESYYFDVIKYHDNIVCCSEKNWKLMTGNYKVPFNGFYFIPSVAPIASYDFMTQEKKAVSKETENILTDFLDYMDFANTECLFVISPFAEKKEQKVVYNYIQEIIEKRGYRFLDSNEYTEEMGLDYSMDFYNEDHVNIFGAEKYTEFLSTYILEHYSVPNRKSDPDYSYMDQYRNDWETEVNNTKAFIRTLIGGNEQ